MARTLLNVSDIQDRSMVNGPGVRAVVWAQGCSLNCPGCFNPHTHPHERRHLYYPQALGRHLASIPGTDGITISGGEPFEQAKACAILAETVRATGRSVVVFTGYSALRLRFSPQPEVQRLFMAIDLLIAGPYVESQKTDGTFWRASRNQTVHVLTDRLAHFMIPYALSNPTVEVKVDGRVFETTGFPEKKDREWLASITMGDRWRP